MTFITTTEALVALLDACVNGNEGRVCYAAQELKKLVEKGEDLPIVVSDLSNIESATFTIEGETPFKY